MAKKTYTALVAITHDGENYLPGDPVELDDKKHAPQLLECGAIEEPAEEEKPAAPAKAAAKK